MGIRRRLKRWQMQRKYPWWSEEGDEEQRHRDREVVDVAGMSDPMGAPAPLDETALASTPIETPEPLDEPALTAKPIETPAPLDEPALAPRRIEPPKPLDASAPPIEPVRRKRGAEAMVAPRALEARKEPPPAPAVEPVEERDEAPDPVAAEERPQASAPQAGPTSLPMRTPARGTGDDAARTMPADTVDVGDEVERSPAATTTPEPSRTSSLESTEGSLAGHLQSEVQRLTEMLERRASQRTAAERQLEDLRLAEMPAAVEKLQEELAALRERLADAGEREQAVRAALETADDRFGKHEDALRALVQRARGLDEVRESLARRDESTAELESRVRALETTERRVRDIEERVRNLEASPRRLEQVEERVRGLEGIGRRVDAIQDFLRGVDSLGSRIDDLESRVADALRGQSHVVEMTTRVEAIEARVAELGPAALRSADTEQAVRALVARVRDLTKSTPRVADLERRLDEATGPLAARLAQLDDAVRQRITALGDELAESVGSATADTRTAVDEAVAGLEGRIPDLGPALERLEAAERRIGEMTERVVRAEGIREDLSSVEGRVEATDSALSGRVGNVEARLRQIERAVMGRLEDLADQMDRALVDGAESAASRGTLEDAVAALRSQLATLRGTPREP